MLLNILQDDILDYVLCGSGAASQFVNVRSKLSDFMETAGATDKTEDG